MSKTKISEYSETAGNNTDINGINIAEGCPPSSINDAIREQMAQLKKFLDGSSGDTLTSAKIVATTAEVTGASTFGGAVIMSSSLSGSTANFSGATTIGGAAVLSSTLGVTNTATMGVVQMADNNLIRPTLLDYAVKGSALGNTNTLATFNLETANFFTATSTGATTWAFTNPVASGDFCGFITELTNGGEYTQAWPAAVDWPGGTAPTLTASGKDQLVFTTRDAGTTWLGFVAGLDIKSP